MFDQPQGRGDTYGRLLAYLVIPGTGDYGLTMLERGHATECTYNTVYRRQRGYRVAERRARVAGRGLWSRCSRPGY